MNKFKLDKFQEEAINASRNNNSIIVSAPTGAGKTLIAEYIIEDCIKNNKGVIYTAPIKALSNQKFRDFSKKYPEKTGILTGDVSINRNAPILIMTTEIFRNAILVNPEEFTHREWIIFDEIHYLDDVERGTVWEETIILLPKQMKILALSATIPNIDQFVGWLRKIHSFPLKSIVESVRPVPLHFCFQSNNEIFSNFKKLEDSNLLRKNLGHHSYQEKYAFSKPNKTKSLLKSIDDLNGYPCVYFCFSRKKCEDLAQETGQFNFLSKDEKVKITKLFNELLDKFNIFSSPHVDFLEPLIKRGIAYHHAGLLPTLKEIIERLFTTGLIKLIFTTETFALGINMPAKTVIFDSLSKFYGRYHSYLKTRDFYQMAGRAGRRGLDKEGYVVSRVNPSHIDTLSLEKIIYGNYEPIQSQFNSCYATILNLYKIMAERIYDIYPKTFHCYQDKAWKKKEVLSLLKRKISLLKSLGYIKGTEITQKAQLAAKVYSFELAIGELFEAGFLDTLDQEDLFVFVVALVYEPRKSDKKPNLTKRTKALRGKIDKFIKNIHYQERHFRIYPLSKKFFFYLSEICRMWYAGASFPKINQYCSIDEGEIVRYFRMSVQVLREISTSDTINSSLKEKISNCLRKINRDVVDAEKQLRQII